MGCAVCGAHAEGEPGLARVIIQGRVLWLCLSHATTVAVAMPETYDEMRSLFPQVWGNPTIGFENSIEFERRSILNRRSLPERRTHPLRVETRRQMYGRRASDF